MIPKERLKMLKPLSDISKRRKEIKGKQHVQMQKIHLTRRARQYAMFISEQLKGSGPKGKKWQQKPLKERMK